MIFSGGLMTHPLQTFVGEEPRERKIMTKIIENFSKKTKKMIISTLQFHMFVSEIARIATERSRIAGEMFVRVFRRKIFFFSRGKNTCEIFS